MSTELATTSADAIERVLVQGDLSKLSTEQRIAYYNRVCESLDLNPLTRPFEFVSFQGKMVMYARKDCTEQIRKRDKVSLKIVRRELVDGVYTVSAQAVMPDGRTDESDGAVFVDGLKGEARANAFMKAETKAKRRVTLSICGLGMLDETEVETIPGATHVESEQPRQQQTALPAKPEPTPRPSGNGKPSPEMERLAGDLIRSFQGCQDAAECKRLVDEANTAYRSGALIGEPWKRVLLVATDTANRIKQTPDAAAERADLLARLWSSAKLLECQPYDLLATFAPVLQVVATNGRYPAVDVLALPVLAELTRLAEAECEREVPA